MRYLTYVSHSPKGVFIAAAVLAGLFVIWLIARLTRRQTIALVPSEATDMIAMQLGRIADALERSSAPLQNSRPLISAPPEDGEQRHVNMSMLGR